MNEIFGAVGTAPRDNFEAYFKPYALGHYIVSRDWATEPTGRATLSGLETQFAGLLTPIGESDVLTGSAYVGNVRGDNSVKVGAGGDPNAARARFNYLCSDLETEMVTQIVNALGLSGLAGAELTNVQTAAKALIIQLGQDHQEFKAFIDDLESYQSNYDSGKYENLLNATDIAQVGAQSNVKLASVDATFPREAIKGAYGSEYTGAFTPYTPYKKDGEAA